MRYTAILIDDEAWTRDALRRLGNWDALGIDIIAEASDGEYGLEIISRLQPDMIVTDVKMPHMNGIELLQILRSRGSRAQVIFVSGYDDYTFMHGAMKLQAMDYLLKPVKPEELNELLARCIRELDAQNTGKGFEKLDLYGFMNVDWVQGYRSLHEAVYESLRADNEALLRARFKGLLDFISGQGGSISRSLEICIYYDLHSALQRFILESGYSLDTVFGEKSPSFVFSNDCTFKNMLDFVESLYAEAQKTVARLVKSKNRIDVQRVKQYIDSNYLNRITLEETAARFYVSKEYLSKVFKMDTGDSFSGYVTGLKMKKAEELLLVDRIPIKDISQMTGYADPSHFYKAFKKYYGMTPGDMLNDIKN